MSAKINYGFWYGFEKNAPKRKIALLSIKPKTAKSGAAIAKLLELFGLARELLRVRAWNRYSVLLPSYSVLAVLLSLETIFENPIKPLLQII